MGDLEPETVEGAKDVRFLSLEIRRHQDGSWTATQANYTLDLLRRNLGEKPEDWPMRKVPMSKGIEELEEGEEIKEAADRLKGSSGNLSG